MTTMTGKFLLGVPGSGIEGMHGRGARSARFDLSPL